MQGRVGIPLGVFRQQLVGQQRTVWAPGDDIGKRAAAIDPELPGRGAVIAGADRIGYLDACGSWCAGVFSLWRA
jgi:hypothetical protein